ncbi:myosin XVB isoform X2 [Paroedura picta]|uniref:myosin XVB isoform X2 n=1 Tax=Paroedura picta TaxID=143630 RepID=UPI0040566990
MKINESLAPSEMDSTIGVVDIHGFEDLGMNSLEQLCVNFANEHLHNFISQIIITQEEEEYRQEGLIWSPVSSTSTASCLDLIAAKPHGILHILDDQTLLPQATDHSFLQKCHYHHTNSPWYTKPKLPLPAFTVQHYAGPVTYQVHKFLNKNHDQLRPEILDIFFQSHLKLVSSIFQRVKEHQVSQRNRGIRGQELKHQSSTLVSRLHQSLQDLTAKLNRSHVFFVRCVKPNSRMLPNIFDTEYVACQLRHSGILEAICIRKEGYPIRIPFCHFLIRYGVLAGQGSSCLPERDSCIAVLSYVVGDHLDLYQIGLTKVFLKEKARQILERRWNQKLSWAIVTLQRNLRGLISRRQFQVFKQKVTFIQAHFRGHLARKRYQRLKKTLTQFGLAVYVSRPVVQRRRQSQDVQLLEIPAELAALLHLAEGQHHGQMNQVTETSPPEVKAKVDLSLPLNINSFPFSTFMKSHFQEASFPALGQPLQQPLTRLDVEHKQKALQLNKLILRFINEKDLQSWQEELLGNYIVHQGLANHSLRNELFSQVASQVWKNPDLERCQRGWLLMAALLSTFAPSPALEKPLLKFVSDCGLDGYNAMCQHKLLTAMTQMQDEPEVSRGFPPTRLEWTANQRKGKMVLDVYTYEEEKISAEVESWTTGEQYAGWVLSSRGLESIPRGWSVSMFTGKTWRDLPGCDFVLDLIRGMEEGSLPSGSSPDYPITPERDEGYSWQNSPDTMLLNIPPAPAIHAPSLPANVDKEGVAFPESGTRDSRSSSRGIDYDIDGLSMPVLRQGPRAYMSSLENEGTLTGRMKGGGKIGPSQQGVFPTTGYSGMMHMPTYQPMPAMGGMMPATMPMMPGLGGMGSIPAMAMPQPILPAVDPSQLAAAQQQAFINQQALLMAQQMTLQAVTLSQQQEQYQQRGRSFESSRPRPPSPRRRSPESPRRVSSWRRSPESPRRVSSRRRSPESPRRVSSWRRSPESPRRVSSWRRSPESPRRVSSRRRSPDSPRPQRASLQEKSPELSRPKKASPPPFRPTMAPKPSKKDVLMPDVPEPLSPLPASIHISQEKQLSGVTQDSISHGNFQKKIEYFQRMGQNISPVKKEPTKRWSPPRKINSEDQVESQRVNSPVSTSRNSDQEMPPRGKHLELTPKPEPSKEIKEIIKEQKSRPVPSPKPIMPVGNVSKPFLKKNDPKEEALSMLGIIGSSPSLPSPVSQESSSQETPPPPPLPPPPPAQSVKLSSNIKEKQQPLMNLFARGPTSPPASGVRLPHLGHELPPPAPSLPSNSESTVKCSALKATEENASSQTQLFNFAPSVCFSYANSTWKLFLRKEVFYPKENFSHPYCLNLLCDQIIRDTYSESCIRISKEEKRKMKDLLVEFQAGMDARSIPEDGMKKRIVVAARDKWANYFSRLFPVKGENGSNVQILGVSHRGLRLLKRAKAANCSHEHLKILCSYSYAEVLSLELIGRNIIQFSLRSEQLILHSPKAQQIKAMVDLFLHELKQDSHFVIALRSNMTDDKSLLNIKNGDYIRLLPMDGLEPGWQFGSIGGRSGLFPSSLVQRVAAPDYFILHLNRHEEVKNSTKGESQENIFRKKNSTYSLKSDISDTSTNSISSYICHYTMVEFAMVHFREAHSKLEQKGTNTDQKNLDPLVQHTKEPIQESLLFCSDSEMNELATKSFMTLMRFMGDQPHLKGQAEVECVYEILQMCKGKENLQDEIYCQVIKQITENTNKASCHRGWQVLSLLTGYFLPSSTLMPYATKYLQQASSDIDSPCSEMARTCHSNLRKLVMYGPRRHVPFRVEMEALLKGCTSRQVSISLPGDERFNTRIKTFTVAAELVKEISEQIGVTDTEEMEEFGIIASKDEGKVVQPLCRKDYVHDYLLEESSIGLSFCRITWKTPMHFANTTYTNIHYHQVLQNYLQGRLLLQQSRELEQEVGTLAVLQHWARGTRSVPSVQELKDYTPEPVAQLLDPSAVQASVTHLLETMKPLGPQGAKIRFIEHVIQLPLFGYSVYSLERISTPGIPKPCFIGVNEEQIIVMDMKSQAIHCLIPLKEIKKVRSLPCLDAFGIPGLEVNYGSAEDPKTTWFELKQAKELHHTIALIMEAESYRQWQTTEDSQRHNIYS